MKLVYWLLGPGPVLFALGSVLMIVARDLARHPILWAVGEVIVVGVVGVSLNVLLIRRRRR